MTEAMHISASLEDYIEVIYHIVKEKQAAKPKDVAERLKVANSSVTGALRILAEKALINYAPYDIITLTPAGKAYAADVVRRHEVLRDFLINVLAVDFKEADEAACRMEHATPKPILERLIQFAEFVQICPRGGEKWITGFRHYCEGGRGTENCAPCIDELAAQVHAAPEKGTRTMNMMKLKDVKPGSRCRVVRMTGGGTAGKRIIEMGVTAGAMLEVERVAPLGDPIDIKIKGYHLSLRKEEADAISVEIL